MNWGTELWDQFDNISAHTQKGIDFNERFSHFVKERCAIESEYAMKLKKLVKSYLPKTEKGDKKKDDDTFSCNRGFYAMVKETNDLAGQHEVICENLSNSVLRELLSSIQESKQERKRLLAEVVKQQNILQNQMSQLDKARSKYEKAFRDAEKAQEVYKKAEADVHMTKADIEKAKQVMHAKVQISDDCKGEYAAEVQKTNDVQRDHYGNIVPQLFNQLQDMEEKRVTKIRSLITSLAEIERQVMPIISKCLDGMTAAATIIDCAEDSGRVIDQYKTGFLPPSDVPFEDLSNAGASQGSNGISKVDTSARAAGTAAQRGKKRAGLLGIFGAPKTEEVREDFGHLPPTQQKKQLTMKIDSLKANLAKETSERDGMLRMQDVYKQNSQLGDPATIEKQLEENAQKLDKLRQEIRKYENYLADAERGLTAVTEVADGTPTPSPQPARHVPSEDVTKPPSASTSKSAKTSPSVPAVQQQVLTEQDSFEDEGVGTCVALYPFEATTEAALSMVEGEQFEIIEQDEGDGWTHVRRSNGDVGFVPTSYIQCSFTG